MKRSAVRPRSIGLSLLLVVFLVLCLLSFAAISAAEAHSDRLRQENSLEAMQAYEEACNYAELTLRDAAREALEDPDEALPELSFSVSAGETEELQVEAMLTVSEETGRPYYMVTSYALRPTDPEAEAGEENLMTDGRIGW